MENRIKELDGIRGVAVLLVMLFHILKRASYLTAQPALLAIDEFFQIGWIGVDLFFVLSGYLITSILLKTRERPDYFKNFYARRMLRIFPLYYLTILVLFPILPLIDPTLGPSTQADWPFFLLYVQNWLYVIPKELAYAVGITWSLAIEEQFYLVWPLIVRVISPKGLAQLTVFLLELVLLARLGLSWVARDLINLQDVFYYGSFFRVDGLLFGALLAQAMQSQYWRKQVQTWAWPIGRTSLLAVIVLFMYGPSEASFQNYPLMTVGYTILAIFFASLLAMNLTLPETSLLRRTFRSPALLFFGKYSYALYLFHMPVVVLALEFIWNTGRRSGLIWVSYIAITFGMTIVLAVLSWHLLEKRVLQLKRYFE